MTAYRTRTAVSGWVVLAAAVAAAALGGCAAHAGGVPVDLSVVDRDTGQVLRVWRRGGRLFVAGRPGARYSLRVNNHTDGRVLVVLSVDGVNILTGETANFDQRGYVFSPFESYDLSGWRKSDTQIAAFTFAPLPQSYAARTGRPGDVGVIGMAVFKERAPDPPPYPEASASQPSWPDRARREADRFSPQPAPSKVLPLAVPAPPPPPPATVTARRAAEAPSNAAAQDQSAGEVVAQRRDEKLGTAHGAREWSMVTTVPFERATRYPQTIRRIEYDTWANLASRGVIPSSPWQDPRPRPFPGGEGYVPDPPPEPEF